MSIGLIANRAACPSSQTPRRSRSTSNRAINTTKGTISHTRLRQRRTTTGGGHRGRHETCQRNRTTTNHPSSQLRFSRTSRTGPRLRKTVHGSSGTTSHLSTTESTVPGGDPKGPRTGPLSHPVRRTKTTVRNGIQRIRRRGSNIRSNRLKRHNVRGTINCKGHHIRG